MFETFPALDFPFCRHLFIDRIPGIDVRADRQAALERLAASHIEIRRSFGFPLPVTAEQTHGIGIAVVDETTRSPVPSVDGLVTNRPGVCLGIHVADCCAVYLLDPPTRSIGLVHSGRKGTDLGAVPAAIRKMQSEFGCDPRGMVAQLSPCIRPPWYEVDFAVTIAMQCRECGITNIHTSDQCTAADLNRYYSYRAEQGKTGRMLALLEILKR